MVWLVDPLRDTEVVIDATSIATASVRGRVLLNGAPPAVARVFLQGGTGRSGARVGQFIPAADGSFAATGLLPGSYLLYLVVGDFAASDGDAIMHDDPIVLAAGQQLARDFTFVRRRLVVRIVQADGTTPAAGLQLLCAGTGLMGPPRTTDGRGQLVFDPAPLGPIRLQRLPGKAMLDAVEMPADKASRELQLTLPAAQPK